MAKHKKEWRHTAARRAAQKNNWKIYILRGWLALSKIYNFRRLEHAIHEEIASHGGEYDSKAARKFRGCR